MLALDSAAPLNAAAYRSAGYSAAGRYLTGEYALSTSEVTDATSHGVGIWSIFEQEPLRPLAGSAAGTDDAVVAVSAARRLGQPKGSGIYVAVDFDATVAELPTVCGYVRSFAAKARSDGYLPGCYGGASVMHAVASLVDLRMQAAGWSYGVEVPGCQLYQQVAQLVVGGAPRDVDRIAASWFGAWNLDGLWEAKVHQDMTVKIQGDTDPIPGSGEAPITGLTAAQIDSVTPVVGVGPASPKGGVGFVPQPDGSAHATAWGWAPGSVITVRVAYGPA